jgi:hypothetical protein
MFLLNKKHCQKVHLPISLIVMCVDNNHRQLLRYEKNGLESAFGTKKKHILKNN